MISVVIDTNVVVSANLVDEGPSAAILSLAIDKKIRMFVSAPVPAEYEEVLYRPRLKFDPKHIEAPWPISVVPPNWSSLPVTSKKLKGTNPITVSLNAPMPPVRNTSSPATPNISLKYSRTSRSSRHSSF
jgi:hypothetical protein